MAYERASNFKLDSPRVVALKLQQRLVELYDADVELGLAWSLPTLTFQLSNAEGLNDAYVLTVVSPGGDDESVDYVDLRQNDKWPRKFYRPYQLFDHLYLQAIGIKIPQPTLDVR